MASVKEVPKNQPLKFGQNWASNSWARYSWYGQMLPVKMSLWQLEYVLDVPRSLPIKFHQNWNRYCWHWVSVVGLDVQSHFQLKPNFCYNRSGVGVELGVWQLELPLKKHKGYLGSSDNSFLLPPPPPKICHYLITSTTKVILEAQWGICSAPCVLRQYTVVSYNVSYNLSYNVWYNVWYNVSYNVFCNGVV